MIRKLVSIDADLARRIRQFRFIHEIDHETEALRQLIELGLAAATSPQRGPAEAAPPKRPRRSAARALD